jgi:ABC-2 type transport system ATP-binding protein
MGRVIVTENLTKDYHTGFRMQTVRAIENLNLEVESREIFGFLGPNGAGKTTTIKVLVGLAKPTSGRAIVLGKPSTDVPIKKQIGFLPESPYFYEYLNPVEYLQLCAQLSAIDSSQQKKQVEKYLKLVRLERFTKMPIKGFSRGMLQRLGIAQALIHNPEVVILDEPMGGLDPIGRREFRDIILNLKTQGKTIFFSTHILADVEMICDRVGILLNGKLISTGRLDEILGTEIDNYEILIKGLDRKMIKVLERLSNKVIPSEDKVLIEVKTEEEVERIMVIIREVGAKLVSLVPRRKTLEDHFLNEIKKERLKEI